ncbi:LOW QUALITY PROTEIN: BUD13 homolog [Ornithodoros turicata]|uniref:LOW QUALITY PROTEIN: BUD13 homolog n=1 Tax=Ornithodoros turicata TaxID=34597 RepID=UPI0031395256
MSEGKGVDKLKYLEKYLAPKEKKKAKKSKHSSGHRLRILDDDVDLKQLPSVQKKAESEDEEAPIVASIVDDRPLHVRVAEQYTPSQWKTLEPKQENQEESVKSSKQSPSKRTKPSKTRESTHKRRHGSDSDLSPERHTSLAHNKTRKRHSHSPGAPPSKRHDSDSDLSPDRQPSSAPIKRGKQSGAVSPSDDASRTKRHDSGSDLSPQRNKGSDSDLSPPRRRGSGSDVSQPRRKGSDSDLSPVRKKGSDSDLSPPRKTSRRSMPSPQPQKRDSHKSRKKADRTSSKEKVKVKKEKEEEKVMEVVKLRDDSKALKAKADAAKEEEKKKIYSRWGKGVVQQEQQEKQLEEHLYEMSKPFSRYEGDADLEKHLKEQDRAGDPMLKYIKKKKASATENTRPRYNGPEPPPNRFGIWPGYRWDGVDRSNGFEKRLVEQKNSSKANEEEAYKWSVEDM